MRYMRYILIILTLVALSTTSFAQSRAQKSTDHYWEIGAGEVSSFTSIHVFGRNTDVDASAGFEIILEDYRGGS